MSSFLHSRTHFSSVEDTKDRFSLLRSPQNNRNISGWEKKALTWAQKVDDARKNIKEKKRVAITKIRTVDVCTFESFCHRDGGKKWFSSLRESKPEIWVFAWRWRLFGLSFVDVARNTFFFVPMTRSRIEPSSEKKSLLWFIATFLYAKISKEILPVPLNRHLSPLWYFFSFLLHTSKWLIARVIYDAAKNFWLLWGIKAHNGTICTTLLGNSSWNW